jgi:magnesium-transporting ATPase (P-type)
MVLTDDNFASIVAAGEEGRGVFDNIKKFILWTLPTNVAQGFVMIVAIFLNMEVLPILPAQILWINMSTAILLGLMLAFEPKEDDIMERKPISPKMPIIDNLLIYRNIMFGTIMAIAVLAFFKYELSSGSSLEQARGVTVSIFVVAQSFYLLNCRSSYYSIFKLGLFTNPFVWLGITLMVISHTIFLYISPVNKFFKVNGIDSGSLIRLVMLGLVIYLIVEFEKFIRKKYLNKKRQIK